METTNKNTEKKQELQVLKKSSGELSIWSLVRKAKDTPEYQTLKDEFRQEKLSPDEFRQKLFILAAKQ